MQQVYQISDLSPQPLLRGEKPIRLAVIGNPIAHSKSPQMQQAALDAASLPYTYIRLLVKKEADSLEYAIRQLESLDFIGVNVTIPFKKQALQLADTADALSKLCGASNTLVFREKKLHAANTDGPGFARAIQEMSGRPLSSLNILILGACGGAGSALAAQCTLSGCPSLTLVNRPRIELQQLQASLAPFTSHPILTCHFDSDDLQQAVQKADLIVNATSLGLHADDALPLPPAWLRTGQFVYDLITHDTPFCHAAKEHGCTVSNGLSMLLWQGAYAFEHWFGFLPDTDIMRAALQ